MTCFDLDPAAPAAPRMHKPGGRATGYLTAAASASR